MKPVRTRDKVLTLNKQGKTVSEISEEVGITESTVRYHLSNANRVYNFPKSNKKSYILALKEQGKTMQEVQKITGYNLEAIRYYYRGYGERSRQSSNIDGPNADRHLCRTCKYRDVKGKSSTWCDYYWRTGVERRTICEVENCTVYERGTPG